METKEEMIQPLTSVELQQMKTPTKKKSNLHQRTMTPATSVLSKSGVFSKHTETAIPLINLLYESLNNAESAHLSVDEFLVLGKFSLF
jgi:hypothetical protein